MITGVLDYLKIAVGLLAGMMLCILFYEGVPVISGIPYINVIPIIGDVAIGHVQVKVNAAVKAAQHGFAIQSEMAAIKAQSAAEAESICRPEFVISAAPAEALRWSGFGESSRRNQERAATPDFGVAERFKPKLPHLKKV